MSELTTKFKKALKEQVGNSDLSFLYQTLFFNFFMDEEELDEILSYWKDEAKKHPEYWFASFHKSVRQTDFFGGDYYKGKTAVSVAGVADAFLYSLIHLDDKNDLRKAMMVAFII